MGRTVGEGSEFLYIYPRDSENPLERRAIQTLEAIECYSVSIVLSLAHGIPTNGYNGNSVTGAD